MTTEAAIAGGTAPRPQAGVLTRDATLALLSSVTTVLGAVAGAAIVFAGPAASAAPLGFVLLLLGTAVAGAVVAWLSRFPPHLAGWQDQPAAILGAVAAGLAPLALSEPQAVATLLAIIVLSSLLFGITLMLLGSFRLGKLAQLIPYPVVGGFLAGVGVLLLAATLRFLTGKPVDLAGLPAYFAGAELLRWLPALAMAALIHQGLKRIRHVLFLPAALAAMVAAFHLVAAIAGIPLEVLRAEGWVFAAVSVGGVLETLAQLSFADIKVSAVAGSLQEIGALVLVCMIGASLAITALEIGTERELDPNHEIRTQGFANLAAAAVGCIPCFTLSGPSLAYFKLGASTRWMPLLRSVFSLALGIAGLPLLAYVPKMAMGALLFLFAFGFITEWLLVARRKMEAADYALVLIIVAIIVFLGFLEGIAAGILIAAVFFLVKYSRLDVLKAELSGSEYRSDVERPFHANELLARDGDRLIVFELQGYIFFGSAITLLDRIRQRIEDDRRKVRYVVLGFQHVGGLDASAGFALKKLSLYARANGIALLFSALADEAAQQLRAAGVMEKGFEGHERFRQTGQAVEWVEERLLSEAGYAQGESEIVDLLADMLRDRDSARILLPYLTARRVEEGGSLFREGDADNDIFILVRGQLSAIMELGDGSTTRLRKFSLGSIVGEMAFYAGGRRSASLVADTPATVFVMRGHDLAGLERREPVAATLFHEMIARLMAQRLLAMNTMVRHLLA